MTLVLEHVSHLRKCGGLSNAIHTDKGDDVRLTSSLLLVDLHEEVDLPLRSQDLGQGLLH